jgi:hypothetical protein
MSNRGSKFDKNRKTIGCLCYVTRDIFGVWVGRFHIIGDLGLPATRLFVRERVRHGDSRASDRS